MTSHRALVLLAALPLASTLLVGCSRGASSPTEPSLALDSPKAITAVGDASRGGGNDDGTTDDNGHHGGGNGNSNGGGTTGPDDHGRNRRGRGQGNHDQPGDHRQRPARGAEFEGAVQAVSGGTITLAGGVRVVVDGQTQFSARGDLRSLGAVAATLAGGKHPRVEGRGTRQTDGSILAQTIKVEVDENDDDQGDD
ncbi:MAG TPA: DUF5666 domain-containing protein [Thermoanaerobaculia bacterium]|jgi:hypothetical protein|nr:DUF5666 domain-containing protein [Thermoanaerobaculia bacterium]